jgi:transposase
MDLYLTSGSVNGDIFEDFVCWCVLPILPFDGQNPRSVVLLDNASIHHLDRVHEIITGCGARLCFLPPYSTDLMSLEEVFAKVKYKLNASGSLYRVTTDPELLIKLAFSCYTRGLYWFH